MMPDKEFLLKLDKIKEKEIYAKVTALNFQELPTAMITGRVTAGTVNVDGNSAVRRTCSLTIVAQNFDYSDYYWGLNTKFKLEIGVKNNIDPSYDDIIWFPQGVYVLTSFNTSRSTTNFTINLSGKDKMCLLNGEVGGSLESSVDFGTSSYLDLETGYTVIEKIPVPEIIRQMLHRYAGEPHHNIIINDLEQYGLELLEYRYDEPLYLYRRADSNSDVIKFDNILIDGNKACSVKGNNDIKKLSDLGPQELDLLVDPIVGGESKLTKVYMEKKPYYVSKIEFGQTAGYRETDLTYPGDLIANIGESITSVLDKIKNMLSDFEYFYDLDGRFIFQRKQSFINTLWSPLVETTVGDSKEAQQYMESLAIASSYSYVFNGAELITAFNNNPNLLNMRNDYSVWGVKDGVKDQSPIHMRYAIDLKPEYYKAFDGKIYLTDLNLFKELKKQAEQDTLQGVYDRINSFELSYEVPSALQKPTKQADGSWSAGWWDIRDWYEYYQALTLEIPQYTMKWYSKNSLEGCVKTNTLPGRENYGDESHVWLVIYNPETGAYNTQHGSGNPYSGKTDLETLYWSYYDENGKLQTEIYKDENGKEVKKEFIAPYSGCDNSHTYLEFLEGDIKRDGNLVYFYNPEFPNHDSFEDLVKDLIEKEYAEYEKKGLLNYVDWREVIYQMALDYYQHDTEDDFELKLKNNNPEYYPRGRTGYEQYYTDLQGYWRQIYNPTLAKDIESLEQKKNDLDSEIAVLTAESYTAKDAQNYVNKKQGLDINPPPDNLPLIENIIHYTNDKIVKLEGKSDKYEDYLWYQNYLSTLQYHYVSLTSQLKQKEEKSEMLRLQIEEDKTNLQNYYGKDEKYAFWNRSVYEAPEQLNFWFDFINESELTSFNVKAVGSRPKVINDTAVKSIYFRETPDIIFIPGDQDEENLNTAFKYIQVGDIDNMFSISSQGKSAKDRIDELIYAHGYCIESVTITAIPIYYLQPNTRIHLYDKDAGLNGDYIISKITIPLTYNGTMQITATKAAENII